MKTKLFFHALLLFFETTQIGKNGTLKNKDKQSFSNDQKLGKLKHFPKYTIIGIFQQLPDECLMPALFVVFQKIKVMHEKKI